MQDKREKMVNKIKEEYSLNSPNVLSVMLQIPREEFVNKQDKDNAYEDNAISVGFGQTISQPYTVAFMTHLLNLTGKEKVLEVGTGSGYQAAILSKLANKVYTMEIIPELAKRAEKVFQKLGYKNIFIKTSSGEYGWDEHAPFEAVIITAALEKEIPQALIDQTAVGGIIVAPTGPRNSQTMVRITKMENGELKKEEFQKFVFVPFVRSQD